ncbi:hypothetical protein J5TS2_38000 [Brevibacillus halotolerans]|nr:hypothetical protein J5TS2_38000 [Brevibacillus halotolerans]
MVPNSKYGRRVSGLTKHLMTGPAASLAKEVVGTFANCSGGVTLWNSILSCEENYQDVVTDCKLADERHYGWVVEVDPFDPNSTPKKHTAPWTLFARKYRYDTSSWRSISGIHGR